MMIAKTELRSRTRVEMEPASLDAPLSLRSEVSDVSSGNRRRQVRPQRGPHERSDPGAVSRRDNAAMGPNSASPSPQPALIVMGWHVEMHEVYSPVCSFGGEGEDQGRIWIPVVKFG